MGNRRGTIKLTANFIQYTIGFIFFIAGCKSVQKVQLRSATYSISLESEGYSDIKKLYEIDSLKGRTSFFSSPSLSTITTYLNCDLKKVWISESDSGSTVSFQLINPILSIKNNEIEYIDEQLLSDLTKSIFIKVNAKGRFTAVSYDSSISSMAATLQKEIVARLQFVRSAEDASIWEDEEENINGIYRAAYKLLKADTASRSYSKQISRFNKSNVQKPGQEIIVNSQQTLQIDNSNSIINIELSEALVTLFGKDTISAIGSRMRVNRKNAGTLDYETSHQLKVLLAAGNYNKWTTLSATKSQEEIYKSAYLKTLGKDNWKTLNEKLQNILQGDKAQEDTLLLKLRALAWLSNADCKKIADKLMQAEPHTISYKVLLKALSITETLLATEQITKVLKFRKEDEKVVMDLLPVLATTKYPAPGSVDLLKEILNDKSTTDAIKSTVQLTLGGMAYNFIKKDSAVAKEIVHFLLWQLKGKVDTVQYLLVLGNTGSPMIIPELKLYLTNPVSEEVKITAINALRFINNKETENMLYDFSLAKDSAIFKATKDVLEFRKMQAN